MTAIRVSMLTLVCAFAAHADFSYTQTRKSAQGMRGAAAGDQTTKHYFKGQKMKMEGSDSSTILDFDAQTLTVIHHSAKTYTVTKFADLGQAMRNADVDAKIDVRETAQRKNINGYNASEIVMTMSVENPQTAQMGMKMQIEMDIWMSPDVPGAKDLRAFYEKNADRFPWAAMAGSGANPVMQKVMADMQKKMIALGGIAVLQVMRMKMAGGNEAQTAQMQQGIRAQLEAMRAKGGQQAAMAEQALARMGAAGGGNGGTMMEITTESTGFSTGSITDAVFAIPDGYAKK
jgi:hypothetical protein